MWWGGPVVAAGVPPEERPEGAGPPPTRRGAKAKAVSGHSDSDGMGSIPASPDARNVPLVLCQERFNEASLSDWHIPGAYTRYMPFCGKCRISGICQAYARRMPLRHDVITKDFCVQYFEKKVQ